MTDLNKLERKRQGVFGMMAGSTHPRTGKLVTAEAETLSLIELVNDYGDVLKRLEAAEKRVAELKSSFDELSSAIGWTKERCEQTGDSPFEVAAELNEAKAELARRDAAAGEPVGSRQHFEEIMSMISRGFADLTYHSLSQEKYDDSQIQVFWENYLYSSAGK